MISKVAVLVVALLVNSASLLLCQWECLGRDAAQAHSSCHAQQEGPAVQAGTDQDCASAPAATATTIVKSADTAKTRLALTPSRVEAAAHFTASTAALRFFDRRSFVIPVTPTLALRI